MYDKKTIKFIDLFAGIGGFHYGLTQANKRFECVYSNEWDKYASSVYKKQFGQCDQSDIRTVDAYGLPDFDLLVGGFPCQAFSIAGKRKGFDDTRGTLFFEIARILKAKKPRLVLLENVKGLLSHDNGRTFQTIIATLDELGYDLQWQVLNSKDFGVPQNRERIFIIGNLRGEPRPQVFPIEADGGKAIFGTITNVYHKGQHTGSYITSTKIGTLRTHKDGRGFREVKSGLAPTIPARAREDGSGQPVIMQTPRGKNNGGFKDSAPTLTGKSYQNNNHVAIPVLTPDRLNKRQNGRRFKTDGEPSFTLTGQDIHGITDGVSIRRLTPLECERLQGFPDNWTKYGEGDVLISDTQRYKMCGNAVTTKVITEIGKKIWQQ